MVPCYSLVLCKSRETIDLIPIGTGDPALAYGVILVNLKLLGEKDEYIAEKSSGSLCL